MREHRFALTSACASQTPRRASWTAYRTQPARLRPESFDEAGVRAAVSKRIEGRTAFSARLSSEPFADDAVWINAFGRRLVGRANIEKFFIPKPHQHHSKRSLEREATKLWRRAERAHKAKASRPSKGGRRTKSSAKA